MEFSDSLKNKLSQNQITQAELCRLTGIPSSLMSAYISAKKSPALSNAISIANALNISLDELVGRDDKKDVPQTDCVDIKDKDEADMLDLYKNLDSEDRAILRGEARGMLRNSKYTKKAEKLSC